MLNRKCMVNDFSLFNCLGQLLSKQKFGPWSEIVRLLISKGKINFFVSLCPQNVNSTQWQLSPVSMALDISNPKIRPEFTEDKKEDLYKIIRQIAPGYG